MFIEENSLEGFGFLSYWVKPRRFRCFHLSSCTTNKWRTDVALGCGVGPAGEVFILNTSLIRWSNCPFDVGHASRIRWCGFPCLTRAQHLAFYFFRFNQICTGPCAGSLPLLLIKQCRNSFLILRMIKDYIRKNVYFICSYVLQ